MFAGVGVERRGAWEEAEVSQQACYPKPTKIHLLLLLPWNTFHGEIETNEAKSDAVAWRRIILIDTPIALSSEKNATIIK